MLSRQSGMNVIELMVAVAIVGLVMALAGPSALTWLQNTQLRNAAESVLTGVQNARTEALKRNTFVSFRLLDPNSTAWIVCVYDVVADACSISASNPTVAQKSASEGSLNARVGTDTAQSDSDTALAPGSGVPGQVVFDSFGRLAATAPNNLMRVDVRNVILSPAEERRLVIYIGQSGQVRMCDPKLAKATNPQGCK
jgi:type IV fimbrial biogenesis protein FimT